ncbi:MAG: hypothetical protein KF773_30840 [Deltaproteobacteria bacterium]|nr:hypothetical protein [Deltaproteobacteria bacterium]
MTAKPPPWRVRRPKTGRRLTRAQVERARARAAAAGRRYPNLVDNLAVIAEDRRRKPPRKR